MVYRNHIADAKIPDLPKGIFDNELNDDPLNKTTFLRCCSNQYLLKKRKEIRAVRLETTVELNNAQSIFQLKESLFMALDSINGLLQVLEVSEPEFGQSVFNALNIRILRFGKIFVIKWLSNNSFAIGGELGVVYIFGFTKSGKYIMLDI